LLRGLARLSNGRAQACARLANHVETNAAMSRTLQIITGVQAAQGGMSFWSTQSFVETVKQRNSLA
jgi:hypothetical protein